MGLTKTFKCQKCGANLAISTWGSFALSTNKWAIEIMQMEGWKLGFESWGWVTIEGPPAKRHRTPEFEDVWQNTELPWC